MTAIYNVNFFQLLLHQYQDTNRPSGHLILPIERVQKRLTKNIKGPRNKPYKERLAILDLPSTECRHSFNDLVFINKIVHGLSDIKLQSLFSPANRFNVTILHRHSYQLYLPKHHSDLLKLAFVIESLNCGTLYLNTYVMLHLLLFLNSLRCLIYVKQFIMHNLCACMHGH